MVSWAMTIAPTAIIIRIGSGRTRDRRTGKPLCADGVAAQERSSEEPSQNSADAAPLPSQNGAPSTRCEAQDDNGRRRKRCDVIYLEDSHQDPDGVGSRHDRRAGRNVAQKAGPMLDARWRRGVCRQFAYKMRAPPLVAFTLNPAHTSQRCSACGHVEAGNRPERARFACLACGHAACADIHAAQNILYLGRKARTGGRPGMACESNRAGGRKQEEDGSSQVAQTA